MSRALQVVVPMAGAGSRFKNAGWSVPKPLIEVEDKKMIEHAMGFPESIECPKHYTFIIRDEYEDIADFLQAKWDADVIILNAVTRGAAETVYEAVKHFSEEQLKDPLLVMDCDVKLKSERMRRMIRLSLDEPVWDGALMTFTSRDPRYSYCQIDMMRGCVVKTAEKKVISQNAVAGAYFFNRSIDFRTAFEAMDADNSYAYPELYMSQTYNCLISNGGKVCAVQCDEHWSLGTPEELEAYLNRK